MSEVGMDSPKIFVRPKAVSNQSISDPVMYATKQFMAADWTLLGGSGNGVNDLVIRLACRPGYCVLDAAIEPVSFHIVCPLTEARARHSDT
jgi:hypothetical protein